MPRGAYDCSGAAPGSFASREGRQMYPYRGGNTPRASQAAVFPGAAMVYQPPAAADGSTTPRASQAYAAPHQGQAMMVPQAYGFHGAAVPQPGFMPQQQQQHHGAYMIGPGFGAPAQQQQQQQPQMQNFQHHGYAPSTVQMPPGVANQGMLYAAGVPTAGYPPQHQQASIYGAGFPPAQPPYYRHP